MTGARAPSPARPHRVDVVASYDLGVDAYDALWSRVILPPAEAVVAALGLRPEARVLDVGAGTGALIPSIRRAAPSAAVVALDASAEMLRAACTHFGAPAARADALALPTRDATADAVLLAFVLFHLSDPAAAMAEAARVLRSGGRVGTVTWAREGASRAHATWDESLAEAGVPPPPLRRADTGLDSREGIESLLAAAGLESQRIWLEPLRCRWERPAFWQLVTGSGVNRLRLQRVDDQTRRDVLARARDRIDSLKPDDFAWWGEVVCAVATKPHGTGSSSGSP